MIYYIVPYLFLILSLPFYKKIKFKKFFFFFSLLPAFFIAIFRGNVGTDTNTYLGIISEIISSDSKLSEIDVEISYFYLVKIISLITSNEHIVVSIITTIYCFLYFIAFSKNKSNIIVSSLFIFPLFFYDSSMNGIRYGISFVIGKIAYDYYAESKIHKALLLIATSLSFHLSGIILSFALFFNKIKIHIFALLSLILLLLLYFSKDYLIMKATSYSSYEAPNIFSGLSLVIIATITYIYTFYFYRNKIEQYTFIFICISISYSIVFFSYAGIRLMYLFIYAGFILHVHFYNEKKHISNKQIIFMSFISFLCFILKLRHFMVYKDGESPFIPYEFIWDINGFLA